MRQHNLRGELQRLHFKRHIAPRCAGVDAPSERQGTQIAASRVPYSNEHVIAMVAMTAAILTIMIFVAPNSAAPHIVAPHTAVLHSAAPPSSAALP